LTDREDLRRAVELLQQNDWRAAHEIVQEDEQSPLACWAHGIVHLMEGDTANARYWYRAANRSFNEDIAAELSALSEALKR
jgi:hypothetical protein